MRAARPRKKYENTLLLAVLLYLPGACDNDDDADNAAADNPAPAVSSGRAVGEVFRDALLISGGEGPEMVVLPTGRFRMGDVSGDGEENERPVQTVTIQRRIAMGRYEVSFAEYGRFASVTGVMPPADEGWGLERRPVINVSWDDAQTYADWLSAETGKTYRLPSEVEWEYAARALTREKCPVCGGALKRRQVEKRLGGGGNTVSLQVRAEVCLHCGARLYAEDVVKSFAVIRDKPRKKAFSHFRTRAC